MKSFRALADHYLGRNAAKRSMRRTPESIALTEQNLDDYLSPLREQLARLYTKQEPLISVVIPFLNEQKELIPTLVSWANFDSLKYPTELICVDNNSNDASAEIVRAAGVKLVRCSKIGLPYARQAGFNHANKSSKYVVLVDSDVRLFGPDYYENPSNRNHSPFFEVAVDYMEKNPNVVGVSTGIRIEARPVLIGFVHKLAIAFGRVRDTGYWSGANQVWSKDALMQSDALNIQPRDREDHRRMHAVNKWAHARNKRLVSGSDVSELRLPVYASGRRYKNTVAYLVNLVVYRIRNYRYRFSPRSKFSDGVQSKEYQGRSTRIIR